MKKLLFLLKQRRVWAGIVGFVAFIVTGLNLGFEIDVPVLTDLLTQLGIAIAALTQSILALWSFIRPKK